MIGNNKKINFCLVGAGRMGARWAKVIFENKKLNLAFVVDNNTQAGQSLAKKHGSIFLHSIFPVLENSNVDVIFVVTPHKFLYFYGSRALQAGKHVFLEKPGSLDCKEMEHLIKLAKRKKKVLMVGFNYRFFDSLSRLKKIVENKQIGKINFIRIKHGHPGRINYGKEWRMNKTMAGGGVLMDQGVHLIDLVNWLFSEPIKEVKSLINNSFWKTSAEDNAFLLLKDKKNRIASVHVSVTQWKPIFSLDIYGDKGYCSIEGLGKKYGGKETLTLGKLKNEKLKEKIFVCNPDADNSLRNELNEFVKSIYRKCNPSPNGHDALNVLKIVEGVYKNSKK